MAQALSSGCGIGVRFRVANPLRLLRREGDRLGSMEPAVDHDDVGRELPRRPGAVLGAHRGRGLQSRCEGFVGHA